MESIGPVLSKIERVTIALILPMTPFAVYLLSPFLAALASSVLLLGLWFLVLAQLDQ